MRTLHLVPGLPDVGWVSYDWRGDIRLNNRLLEMFRGGCSSALPCKSNVVSIASMAIAEPSATAVEDKTHKLITVCDCAALSDRQYGNDVARACDKGYE